MGGDRLIGGRRYAPIGLRVIDIVEPPRGVGLGHVGPGKKRLALLPVKPPHVHTFVLARRPLIVDIGCTLQSAFYIVGCF